MIKGESEDTKLGKPPTGRAMPFKLAKLHAGQAEQEQYSVSALFEPIINEIRDYLENVAKGGDDE